MAYGWRKLFVGNREKHELAREKMWSRIHIMPLLQAEEDRDQVRRMYADKAREKELLGSETRVMNSERYVLDQCPFVAARKPAHELAEYTLTLECYRFVRPTFSYSPGLTKQ